VNDKSHYLADARNARSPAPGRVVGTSSGHHAGALSLARGKNHSFGAMIRPDNFADAGAQNDGDTLALDILAVACPDPGCALTVVMT
jgi:hypothetical protein